MHIATPTMSVAETADEARAGFYLCLARAFMTPSDAAVFRAARDYLAADLAELSTACGYAVGSTIDAYVHAMAGLPDHLSLQVVHARLFLMPGDPHPSLNTGAYLDGGVAGGSVTAMLNCYRRCGLEQQEGFHDLPDHPAMQLEFVSWLFAAHAEGRGGADLPMRAGEFLAHFVSRWAGAFRADVEAAGERFKLAANPYAPLARLIEIAAQADAVQTSGHGTDVDPEILRLRMACAGHEPDVDDLATIRARLAASGHATGHLGIPVEQRDEAMGFQTLAPPRPPRVR